MNKLTLVMLMLAVLTVTSVAAAPGFGAHIPVITNGENILITGEFIDAPVGAEVQLVCGINTIGPFPIMEGAFTINTVYGGINGCAPGIATLKVGEVQVDVTIPAYITINPTGGSAPIKVDILSLSDSEDVGHMPEFSTVTLGLAIVGVGLGLAFLRKH